VDRRQACERGPVFCRYVLVVRPPGTERDDQARFWPPPGAAPSRSAGCAGASTALRRSGWPRPPRGRQRPRRGPGTPAGPTARPGRVRPGRCPRGRPRIPHRIILKAIWFVPHAPDVLTACPSGAPAAAAGASPFHSSAARVMLSSTVAPRASRGGSRDRSLTKTQRSVTVGGRDLGPPCRLHQTGPCRLCASAGLLAAALPPLAPLAGCDRLTGAAGPAPAAVLPPARTREPGPGQAAPAGRPR
jgi:hypothetical protein